MTKGQRQLALDLCDRILQTAAKLQTDLAAAAAVIGKEIESRHRDLPAWRQPSLDESDAEFLRLAPSDAAVHILGFDQELEPIAPDQGGIDIKTSAVGG
jgi:hypothetical protein